MTRDVACCAVTPASAALTCATTYDTCSPDCRTSRPSPLLDDAPRIDVVEVHLPVAGHPRRAGHRIPSFLLGSGGAGKKGAGSAQDGEAGQGPALEVLEAGPAPRGDVTEVVVGEPQ